MSDVKMPTNEEMSSMAPSDPEWHSLYAKTFNEIWAALQVLQNHPSFSGDEDGAEDLGDYVLTLSNLISFRPRTHEYFEKEARK